jgi:hypothetical protein
MKKFLSVVVLLTILALSLFGCSSVPPHFKGEWKFSQISKVELSPDVTQNDLDALKERYSVDTEEGVLTNARARYIEDGTFESFYIKFNKKYTLTDDPFADREVTWVFYQTGENEGFLSFDGYLDASLGNPDPVVYPNVSYNPETDTMQIVLWNYGSFMITIALTR